MNYYTIRQWCTRIGAPDTLSRGDFMLLGKQMKAFSTANNSEIKRLCDDDGMECNAYSEDALNQMFNEYLNLRLNK